MSRTALVTGAGGFIGGVLAAKLAARGDSVVGMVRRMPEDAGAGVRWVVADLPDELPPEALAGVDTVYHLASRVHQRAAGSDRGDEREHHRITVEGTERLLAAAAAAGVQVFVYFSSFAVMPEGVRSQLDELAPAEPRTAYARAKLAAEQRVLAAPSTMRTACLRLPMVYGPGQKGNLDRMLQGIAQGWFPPLPDWRNRRSMIHVEDAAEAALVIADALASGRADREVYIAAEPEAYSSREVYEALARGVRGRVPRWRLPGLALTVLAFGGEAAERALGRPAPFDRAALARLREWAWYSPGRLEHDLGFRARRRFPDSVADLVRARRAIASRP